MPVDFEKKFRLQGLDEEDEAELRNNILVSRNGGKLISYLYIYGRSFKENDEILKICDYYIKNQVAGLTAVCMQVAIDYWNKFDNYYDALEQFLNIELFEEWYDEVIFTVSFINRNRNALFPRKIMAKFADMMANPRIKSLRIL